MGEAARRAGMHERVLTVDSRYASPELRAQYLYAQLQTVLDPKPTIWDMACFSAEFIGMLALMEPAFKEVSKTLSAILYEAHYIHGKDLNSCLSPSHSLTQQPTKESDKETGVSSELASMELTLP